MKITQLKRLDAGTTSPVTQVRGTDAQDTPVTGDAAHRHQLRRRYAILASSLLVVVALAWLMHAWSNSSHTVAADRLRKIGRAHV